MHPITPGMVTPMPQPKPVGPFVMGGNRAPTPRPKSFTGFQMQNAEASTMGINNDPLRPHQRAPYEPVMQRPDFQNPRQQRAAMARFRVPSRIEKPDDWVGRQQTFREV